jgi:hypothetical protein
LNTGKVLVAGGRDSNGNALASEELYDPVSETWDRTGSLATARSNHTATLMDDGDVIYCGNNYPWPPRPHSAEIYDVGLGFNSAWQPIINNWTFTADQRIVLTGSRFQGISQASGGNTQDSSTNYPIMQVRSIDSGQVVQVGCWPPDQFGGGGWSNTSFTSLPVTNFPQGPALVTVFTNGIPSTAQYVVFEGCNVVNGDFETGSLPPWINTGDTSATGVGSPAIPHSGSFALFAGPVTSDGFIDQVLPTVAGTAYDVSFWLENDDASGNNRFGASLGGITLVPEAVQSAFGYTQFTFNSVIPGANADLHFIFYNPPSYFYLDDVCVSPSQ